MQEPQAFNYIDVFNQKQTIPIAKDSLCFTYCQVPVIYTISDGEGITVIFKEGSTKRFEHLSLDNETSTDIFNRSGKINQIHVAVTSSYLK